VLSSHLLEIPGPFVILDLPLSEVVVVERGFETQKD
jgi:hypothetical protein